MKNPMNSWDDPCSPARLDLVFEHRFRDYGAFSLRKNYSKSLNIAFAISLSVMAGIPILVWLLKADPSVTDIGKLTREVVVELSNPEKTVVPEPLREIHPSTPKPSGGLNFSNPLVQDSVQNDSTPTQSALSSNNINDGKGKSDSSTVQTGFTETGTGTAGSGNVFMRSEIMPEFPGGESALFAFLAREIHYPRLARENGISGTVYLRFVVDREGHIREVESLRDIGGGCADEAIRVVKRMPRWSPGKQNGQEVNVLFHLPVRFSLR
ncbi:MAG: energy transducer TonB [Bacteroidota bacterium]